MVDCLCTNGKCCKLLTIVNYSTQKRKCRTNFQKALTFAKRNPDCFWSTEILHLAVVGSNSQPAKGKWKAPKGLCPRATAALPGGKTGKEQFSKGDIPPQTWRNLAEVVPSSLTFRFRYGRPLVLFIKFRPWEFSISVTELKNTRWCPTKLQVWLTNPSNYRYIYWGFPNGSFQKWGLP